MLVAVLASFGLLGEMGEPRAPWLAGADLGAHRVDAYATFLPVVSKPGEPAAEAGLEQGLAVREVRVFHRAGQTFITWLERPDLAGERYRVYRSIAPITLASLERTALEAELPE